VDQGQEIKLIDDSIDKAIPEYETSDQPAVSLSTERLQEQWGRCSKVDNY
jgi:hypothetical protein